MSIASEAKQRVMAREIVGDNLAAERGAFTFSLGKGGGEVVKEAPFVYCPNLIAKVADCVEHNKRQALIKLTPAHVIVTYIQVFQWSYMAPRCYPC